VYVDEKGHPPFATNYEVSSFEQAKEKFKEILACRLIAPFDTFLLTSLEKFHNRLKTYPGFPK